MSSTPSVFIDGQAGTTGLRIHQLLANRTDLRVVSIDPERRKDPAARAEMLNGCDAAILCLPDDAAREAVALIEHPGVAVVDASTAHRVADDWQYGLPELLPGQREAIAGSKRIANPGCYPTGTSLLLRPLVDAELLPADFPLTVHALSGYSGGGRALIEKWEGGDPGLASLPFEAPYALGRRHKHIPEMRKYAGLKHEPQFVPAVGPFRSGMRIEIPVHCSLLPSGVDATALHGTLFERYRDEACVRVLPLEEVQSVNERTFDPRVCEGTNRIELHVLPNAAGHVLLVAILDNLGKGASGAAVQNLNLALGLDELAGLKL
ncbi:MAG: N-acetyl-gamma-glutamyl-phosphate reductase [Myxococcales bacterium]|jgi:N-acetyl-gamma-glutamyl-phosphate reductase